MSDLLPQLGELADEMCFIHSLTSQDQHARAGREFHEHRLHARWFPEHRRVGHLCPRQRDRDLPAFVAIPDPRGVPQAGPNNWTSGFLPAVFQGTPFNAEQPIQNLARPAGRRRSGRSRDARFPAAPNDEHLKRHPGDTQLAARIASYELAARMQLSAAEVGDLSRETADDARLYGTDDARSGPRPASRATACSPGG